MSPENKFTNWRKSTRSSGGDNCVEVATATTGTAGTSGAERVIGVRDSKQRGRGPVLEFTPAEWRAFVEGVKGGEFDLT